MRLPKAEPFTVAVNGGNVNHLLLPFSFFCSDTVSVALLKAKVDFRSQKIEKWRLSPPGAAEDGKERRITERRRTAGSTMAGASKEEETNKPNKGFHI